MKKAVVIGLILTSCVPARAVQLRLAETFGAAYVLGEENAGHIMPGFMINQAVLFEFESPWSLEVSYFGGSRIGTSSSAMEDAAIAQERAAMADWLAEQNIDFDPADALDRSDLALFESFSGNSLWGGASLRYTLGDRDGRSAYIGLGANYFSVPRVDYAYGFRRGEYTYEDDLGNEVETAYNPSDYFPMGDDGEREEFSRAHNNETSVEERSGVGAVVGFGLLWKVSDAVRFHANLVYNEGISEDLTLLGGGVGVGLALP